ncbi:MAG: phosphoglycerate mutase (2,3-diphosphoglycerate-independent) [Candidatus Magasanikbacteria bacterium RIFOXYD2_FULL_41_14]|uniref:2,3-bisphosphoglycerate-independent phosphoglycerate mutase n=1 Tax=Candidatus Magasanikbacteria bacterium RIFOXYD2_FULL_41_14 TaxID=1798709 RepID=A0A1F6PDV0_9BACT|nr:MAG: phosphoglycerate mutase (2,3-diphosphoglycerate-independent) [Candidatus Magasanikbacteria bacterium RIFOXYD2_FULL_41_14]
MSYKPVVLTIFDGLGVAPPGEGNAVTLAVMKNFNKFIKEYPVMTLFAAGNEVGLMFGEMGNSEVGHLNIGAGRVYYQSCPRINQTISDGSFFTNPALLKAIIQAKEKKTNLHLIGLLSAGNIHASESHLYALLDLCRQYKLSSTLNNRVFVHVILDGRDAPYNSGADFVRRLQDKMNSLKVGKIASLSGRYYAMDRDNRWDRVEKAYRAMALGESDRISDDPIKAILDSYEKKVFDEEFIPTVITKRGAPVATFKEGDAAIFFNFRPDRARQLTKAFVLPGFDKFERPYLRDLCFVTMSEYEKDLPVSGVAFNPLVVVNSLAETISKAGKKQFHLAETEKYAHVTYFLNGAVEDAFPGEDRSLIPSPQVSSYNEAPEMSAALVAKEAAKAIDSGKYDFVVVNLANPDMVGHTGDLAATVRGCEAADKAFGNIVDHTLAVGGVVVMTADHGNSEEVINFQTGDIDKEHTTNPVPLLIIGKDFQGQAGPAGDPPEGDLSLMHPVGVLADIAPTVLKLMGVEKPGEMTGTSLI